MGMKSYWCQFFILPKKVIKKVEAICQNFLWNCLEGGSKKAAVAWDTLCSDYLCGGLGLKNFEIWNKAVVLKLLRAMDYKKERLWVQ